MNKELNTTDGWEEIVNDVERHNARIQFEAKRARRKLNRMIGRSINCTLAAAVCMAFGAANLLADWLAVLASAALICSACVIAGRVWEQYHRGW